jgi:hypothetical protein
MRIIAGEHRWRGAKAKGLGQVPALILDVDDDAALRILLADNRTAEIGGYDDPALAELLRSLDDLDGTGWTEQDLDDLADAIAADNAVALTPERAPTPGSGRADQAGTDDEEELPEPGDADAYAARCLGRRGHLRQRGRAGAAPQPAHGPGLERPRPDVAPATSPRKVVLCEPRSPYRHRSTGLPECCSFRACSTCPWRSG